MVKDVDPFKKKLTVMNNILKVRKCPLIIPLTPSLGIGLNLCYLDNIYLINFIFIHLICSLLLFDKRDLLFLQCMDYRLLCANKLCGPYMFWNMDGLSQGFVQWPDFAARINKEQTSMGKE